MLLMRDGSAQAVTALGPEVWRRLAIALLTAPGAEPQVTVAEAQRLYDETGGTAPPPHAD